MRIIILGAGGIGSLIGALLSKENDVLLIGRKEQVDKINKDGLDVEGVINENFKVKAAEKIEGIEDDALIILTTKTSDIESSLKEIKHLIKKNNTILVLQNGLGNEELVKSIVDCDVVRGIIRTATTFVEPGKVACNYEGQIYLEDSEISKNLMKIFNKTMIKASIPKDMKKRVWVKLIFNCAINPVTAILKVKNNELSKIPDLIKNIVDEILLVAEKEGLRFNNEEIFDMIVKIIKDSGGNISSMLQDILKGRKTEIDFLNGKVVELGKKHNVKTPVNEMLVSMVKFLEKQ